VSDTLPLVSIITPAYNRARYLDETIQSVLNQDYPRIEYIVLDDGSTDNTREVLESIVSDFGEFFSNDMKRDLLTEGCVIMLK
jgi:glycosyltransferase involved in cell wall biosynthesis